MILKHEAFLNLELKHGNQPKSFHEELYSGVTTFNQWNSKAKKLSTNYQQYGYKTQEKMIGDMFEIFAEIFFKSFPCDNTLGIYDYNPVSGSEDYGVDGIAKGILDQTQSAIQVKWRSNPTVELVSNDLKQFVGHAYTTYDIDKKSQTGLIVFTNTAGLHWHTDTKVLNRQLRVINGEKIKGMVDGNLGFWKSQVHQLINNTLYKRLNRPAYNF